MNDLKWLRENRKVTASEMAGELGLSVDEYEKFEAETGASRLDRLPVGYKKVLVAAAADALSGAKIY